MIQKVKDKFRNNPTWFGVTVGLTIIFVALICIIFASDWYVLNQAKRVAKQTAIDEVDIAVGKKIDELGEILDGFQKLEMSQTNNQNINLPPSEAELRDKRQREMLQTKGYFQEPDE